MVSNNELNVNDFGIYLQSMLRSHLLQTLHQYVAGLQLSSPLQASTILVQPYGH